MEDDFNDLSGMFEVGKFTTTLDMLMHQHPWLAEMLQWRPIESFDIEKEWFKDTWYQIVTSDGRVTIGKPFSPSEGVYAWVAGYGANCSDPKFPSEYLKDHVTHWLPLSEAPGSVGWKNFRE